MRDICRHIRISCAALAVLLVLALAPAGPARAQSLVLDDLVLDNQSGSITVRFGLHVEEAEKVAEELREGVVLGLVAEAELTRSRLFIPDRTIGEAEFVSTLRYDALAKEYVLELPGREQPLRKADLNELTAKAWNALSLDLGPWSALTRDSENTLYFELRLTRLDVPVWLKSALFFWDWEAAPMTTYTLDFRY